MTFTKPKTVVYDHNGEEKRASERICVERIVSCNSLDSFAEMTPISRMFNVGKPEETEMWRFRHDPTYADAECTDILYDYVETDESLRDRIAKSAGHGNTINCRCNISDS